MLSEIASVNTLGMAVGLRFNSDSLVCIAMVALIVFLATSTRRSAKRCPRCREINREHARFCAQCGANLLKS